MKRHIFLMYCGKSADGKQYRSWNNSETLPLITYSNMPKNPFFQSFLILAIRSGNGGSLVPGFGNPGNKTDWLVWIEDIFLPDQNLAALIDSARQSGNSPLDIWIALPYPDPAQTSFGKIFNIAPDLSSNHDRVFVIKWWIHKFLARWRKYIIQSDLNRYVSLRGFYWSRESMTLKDRMLLPGVISYIHSKGLKTLWIPYYAATPFLKYTNPGFDIVIIQPSYLQNPELGWQRLLDTAKLVKKHRAGIEIEFDTSVVYQNSKHYTVALDYLNRGLPQYDGYLQCNYVAYYTGYKTVVELYNKKNPLYDYLYQFVSGTFKKIEYPGINY